MGAWIADALHDRRRKAGTALVLGLTFKENVPDLRNSRSFDLVKRLQWLGHEVDGRRSARRSPTEVEREHGLEVAELDGASYDLVVGAVAHRDYRELRRRAARRDWSRRAARSPTSRACGATARSIPRSTGGRCEARSPRAAASARVAPDPQALPVRRRAAARRAAAVGCARPAAPGRAVRSRRASTRWSAI